jgi:outer membrane protein assembly factor BamA
MLRITLLATVFLFTPVTWATDSRYTLTPSPVIGYDPTYGWLLGAALFVYPDETLPGNPANRYFDILAMHVDGPAWMLRSHFKQRDFLPGANFSLEAVYSDFYSPWFGEGDATPDTPLYKIDQRFFTLRPAVEFPLKKTLEWSLFVDYRQRRDQGVDGDPSLHLFPDETTTALGIGMSDDTRSDHFSPRTGHLAELKLSRIGPESTNLDAAKTVWQLEGEWRQYADLSHDIAWAGRLTAGISDGDPGYLFRYALGGAEKLRGLEGNRLRGKRYWLVQNEVRYPIWRFISGTAFIESGSVGEESYGAPRTTYGVGLRFGLPPDFRVKLRFDFARTEGEETLTYIDFGHAF